MPTLQALLRAHRKGITPDNYFTAAAHPPVFRGEDIDPSRWCAPRTS